jgi:hypothetical protein
VALIVQAGIGTRAGAGPPPRAEDGDAGAQAPPTAGARPDPAELEGRLRRLEALGAAVLEQNRRLTEQNRRLAEQNQQLSSRLQEMSRRQEDLARRLDRGPTTAQAPAPPPGSTPRPEAAATTSPAAGSCAPASESPSRGRAPGASGSAESRFLIGGYDDEKGQFILVQPRDAQRTPFALSFDLITELRYTGFARSTPTWTDSTGTVRPVRNISQVQVNRNWFQFSGYALDPRLQFQAVVFNSSTNLSTIFLGWIDYEFSRAFILSAGYFKVPGSREWYDSFRYTLGADRTMATTFFRPGMSPGIWASGVPLANLHYIAMLANSFNGLDLAGNRIGSNLAFSGSLWWEPFGKFGPGPSDIEWHERPTLRIGSSLAVSRELLPGPAAVQNNPENTLFRVSDGTPLSQTGTLAPGVTVNTTSVQLWAIDAALKCRGLGLSGEYYFRWLDDLRATGGRLPIRSLFAHGAYAQASYFLVPERLEGFARFSFVDGHFGGGDEWAGGLNYYVRGTRNWRMTFDVTRVIHSPAENLLTGYRAGESGTLFQLQMLTDF